LDYTLATSNDSEARLDVVLDLTPNITQKEGEENRSGGWEVSCTSSFFNHSLRFEVLYGT
jgi:hypothetical protein